MCKIAIVFYAIAMVLYSVFVVLTHDSRGAADVSAVFTALFVAAAGFDVMREGMSRWRFATAMLVMAVAVTVTQHLHRYFCT
jgi:drug/metabolite transporter (DMT)-like permease